MEDPISGIVEKSADGSVIKETFEVTSAGVQSVRNEMPIGVGGSAIQRTPWHPKGELLVRSGTYIKKMGGQERCLRLVEIPLKDGGMGKFHCSMPCLSSGNDGDKYCPDHDKEVFAPQQSNAATPARNKVLNSAGIVLTEGEQSVHWKDKDGVAHTAKLEDGNAHTHRADRPADIVTVVPPEPAKVKRARAARPAEAPKRPAVARGTGITIRLALEEMATPVFMDTLCSKLVEALNALPAKNVAEMEKIIALREQVKEALQ